MMLTRRQLLLSCAAFALIPSEVSAAVPYPDQSSLQSGDLLWPKLPGAYIPYSSPEPSADEAAWEAGRQIEIEALRANLNVTTAPRLRELKDLSFSAFRDRYYRGVIPGEVVPYSGGVAAVGHVGIVEVAEDGSAFVIDANPEPGVCRTSYADWIDDRVDHIVWQGRLRNRTAEERNAVAIEAAKYVGRPYDFWNFDLNDDQGFYCSKLVWLAAFRALGVALDGNTDPRRSFWYSPKQCLNSPDVEIVLDQGNYGYD